MFLSQAVPWRFTLVLILLNIQSVVKGSDGDDSATLPGQMLNLEILIVLVSKFETHPSCCCCTPSVSRW